MKKTPLKRKSKSSISKLQKTADKLLQEVIRFLYKKCEACGAQNQVGHHWIEKSRSSFLRYDLRNIIPLCTSCHAKIHNVFGNSIMGGMNIVEKIIKIRGKKWKEEMDKLQPEYIKVNNAFYEDNIEKLNSILIG